MFVKRLIWITPLLVFICVLFGCDKENNSSNEGDMGSVFGTVIDLGTNEPVANAIVQLQPDTWSENGDTRRTGYDGMFEFLNVEEGDYYLTVSRNEYDEYEDDNVINVRKGKRIRRDVRIEKLPVVYTNDVTEIISSGYSGWNEVNWGATFNGYVASVGSPAYVERGFCYTDNLPYLTYVKVPGNGIGNYSKTVTGLSAGTLYLVMAYVKTSTGQLVYGQEIIFSTSNVK